MLLGPVFWAATFGLLAEKWAFGFLAADLLLLVFVISFYLLTTSEARKKPLSTSFSVHFLRSYLFSFLKTRSTARLFVLAFELLAARKPARLKQTWSFGLSAFNLFQFILSHKTLLNQPTLRWISGQNRSTGCRSSATPHQHWCSWFGGWMCWGRWRGCCNDPAGDNG